MSKISLSNKASHSKETYYCKFLSFSASMIYNVDLAQIVISICTFSMSRSNIPNQDRNLMGDLPGSNPGICRQGIQVWPTNGTKLQLL